MRSVASPEKLGGGWLIADTSASRVFTPERCNDEHRLIAQATREFVAQEVLPGLERMDQKDWKHVRYLLRQCGKLGLLGIDASEAYGGVELDTPAAVVVAEGLAASASFGATYGAQCNLAIIPLLFFGTDAQRSRYLPGLVSGETVGAYALSESGSGSDALNAKTHAARLPDGSFVLNGEKLWITNGGFADLFIVFAKVNNEQLSAFIVERTASGVSIGGEEHKLGLQGSSTTPLLLDNAKVPANNLLGQIGQPLVVERAIGGSRAQLGVWHGLPEEIRQTGGQLPLVNGVRLACVVCLFNTEEEFRRNQYSLQNHLDRRGERAA